MGQNVVGLDAKIYYNTGSFSVPVWVEITEVRDLTLGIEMGEAELASRTNSGWRLSLSTLKEATIDFSLLYDKADPAGFEALKAAFFDRTSIEVWVLDGDVATSGSEGLRGTMIVTNWTRNEPLEEALNMDITLKPTCADNAPSWDEV